MRGPLLFRHNLEVTRMAARVYADPDSHAEYTPQALRLASRVVDRLLVGRVYAVDVDGNPTDADVAQALEDATVAIAAEVTARGTLDAGSTQQWESVSIGTVSLQTLQGASATDTPMVDGVPVPPAARLALQGVGHLQVVAR